MLVATSVAMRLLRAVWDCTAKQALAVLQVIEPPVNVVEPSVTELTTSPTETSVNVIVALAFEAVITPCTHGPCGCDALLLTTFKIAGVAFGYSLSGRL